MGQGPRSHPGAGGTDPPCCGGERLEPQGCHCCLVPAASAGTGSSAAPATGTWALVGERRAGGVRLCSPAPSGAGVGAGPRVPCEQHRMAGHCALCCKRPLHGPYSRGQAVMNKDMLETLARGGVLRDRQGTGCSPVGGACPGR